MPTHGPNSTGTRKATAAGRRLTQAAIAIALLLGIGSVGWYFAANIAAMITAMFELPQRPTVDPPPPPPDPRQRIIDFVNAYDGGDCFFVAPETVDRDTVTVDALGREGGNASLAPFELLGSEFNRSFGFEATINVHQVTAQQCPAVDFLFQTRHQPDSALRLDIVEEKIQEEVNGKLRKGVRLTGTISGTGDGIVTLLLASDDGYVYTQDSILKPDGAAQTFEQKIFKDNPGIIQPQLLIAIVSSKPLNGALKSKLLWSGADGIQAEELFPQMSAELARTGQTLHVRAKYVKLTE